MKNLIVIIAILLSSCVNDPFKSIDSVVVTGDDNLKPYVYEFLEHAKRHNAELHGGSIQVLWTHSMLDESTYGRANRRKGTVLLSIPAMEEMIQDRNFDWKNPDTYTKRVKKTMIHELGHALLDRNHCCQDEYHNATVFNGINYVEVPYIKSLMQTYHTDRSIPELDNYEYWNYLWNELFTGNQNYENL